MKREFLTNLGLEQDVINQVMAEHGKGVQAEKDKYVQEINQLKADLTEAQQTITQLNNDLSQSEVNEDYKGKYEQEQELRKSIETKASVQLALIKSGGKEKYLDTLQSKLDEEDFADLETSVTKLKGEYPELFNQPDTDSRGYKVIETKLDEGKPASVTKESIMAIEDKKERQRLIAENLELFN